MQQLTKFYLASFLKNQTYFVPVMIIFFQNLGLSYSQIFWIFTAGSVLSFLIEIPTGIFADVYGKRTSIILSKFVIFLSFIFFGFSSTFLHLLLANLVYELGKAFRSGTETAYVYDYLRDHSSVPYIKVKATQKFYARVSESLATAAGGFLAVYLGFSYVFFLAAVPAFVNFAYSLTWSKIKENEGKVSFSPFTRKALSEVYSNPQTLRIVLNIVLFTSVLAAADKFIQPYMKSAGVEIAYFGLIYSAFLIIVAFLVRYVSRLEKKFGGPRLVNALTLVSFVPLLVLGLGHVSVAGVFLFFFVLAVENVRSPVANDLFHKNVQSHNRSTLGSILELFKSSVKLIILPLTGYVADFYSLSFAVLALSFVVLANAILFRVSGNSKAL